MLNDDYSRYERVPAISAIMENNTLESFIEACISDPAVTLFINTSNADENIVNSLNTGLLAKQINLDDNDNIVLLGNNKFSKDKMVYFEMFGNNGIVEFSENTSEIYINGTAAPGGEISKVKVVLYDNVLQRPVVSAWMDDSMMKTKEFTSDILDNYK